MGFYNALTSGACSIDGSGRCSSQDAPNAGCVLPVFAKKGTGTLQIGYKYSGMTRVRADSNCLKLPLKSGGLLSLAWHQFTGLASSDPTGSSRLFAARPEGWQTGGQSGMFSFLPYISNVSSLGAFNKFTDVFPVSSDGLTHYKRKGISGAIHYFETVNPMPMRARYDHSTYYFYDFDFDSSTYFKYGGTNNALDGRVIYTRDLFGNQLDYTYSARQVNPSGYSPLLRKITGNISGVTPYFEYGDASNEQFIPAPIKKIFIKDEADSSKSRTVYYDYNSYTSAPNCFLNAITYPTGCRTHYRFSVDGGGHPFMIKEADAEGYATYFNWTGTSSIRKVMEPEGILTYYRYDTANLNTLETPLPKSTAYYKYTLSSDASGNIEQLSKSVDRMRNTTYYQWTYFAANNFYGNHLKRKHAPNGFVQYFEYNDKNSMTLLARHSRRIQYSYAQNERDVSKVTNARGYTSYFAYTNRILTSTVHPDGSSTTSSLDSIGRVRSACDARGNTTYFNYDPNTGSMASQVMPGGSVAYFRYNSFRNLVRDVSPRWSESSFAGFTTYYEFNSLGRPIKKIDPLSGLTYFSYTSRNDLSTITSPNAMTRVYVYDGKRRLTNYIVEANNGDVIETVSCYDSTGNGVYDVSPSLLVEQNRFDNNDRNTAFSRGLTNVQGFWPLHESSGNRADESGRNNLLIDNNTVGSASGLFGLNAAQFIRSNSEYLSITNAAQTGLGITGALSLAGFFQISNIATGTWLRPIASKWGASATSDRGYSFGIRRDSTTGLLYPYFLLSSNGGSSYELVFGASFNFSVNTWYHLAATYEPQTKLVCIYVDGVRVAMRYCTQGSIKSNTAEFRLGVHASTESITWAGIAHTIQYFDGLLEDVYVFDVAIARALVELLSRQDRERKIKDASVTTYGYYSFDSVGNRRKVTDARQNTTYFNFNMYSEVASVKKADGSETYYFYDLNGNLTVSRDPRLHSTYFSYDPRDQQNCVRDALGRSTYFFFDANGNTTRWRNARLNTTYFFYDPMDRVKARRDAQGNSAYFFFDANGNVIRSRNERLNTTYHFYDALDRRRSTRDALANLTYYYFDSVGNTTRVKDPKGNTTYFFYDGFSRLRATRNARAAYTYYTYDADSNQATSRDAQQNTTYYFYDALNRQRAVRNPLSQTVYFGYDAASNRRKVQSPRLYSTYFAFDAVNRLSSVTDPENGTSSFGYDPNGNLRKTQDPLSRTTYFAFDALNRVSSVLDAADGSITFGYDVVGNRRLERDARSNSTYFNFDSLNRVTSIVDPLGVASNFGYDANSNLLRNVDGLGVGIYFQYDALDRRTRIAYPTQTQYFEFDAMSNLTRTADSWGDSNFGYDELSRLTRRNTPRGDSVYYAYDSRSSLSRLQYPQGTLACYYTYDAAGRMTQADSTGATRTYFVYDASSNIAKKRFGNGTVAYYAYDKSDRVTSIRHFSSAGGGIAYFDYNRDVAGRTLRIGREGGLAVYYTYDAVDRLSSETWREKSNSSQVYAFSYSYDATGNRTRMRRELRGTEFENAYYTYNGTNALIKRHRLFPVPITTTYYAYDANGSLVRQIEGTNVNTTYFEYAANQLLTKVIPPVADGSAWQFSYDSRLNRYKIDRAGTIRYLLWDGLNCMEERNNDGTLFARYTYGYSPVYGIGNCVEIYLASTASNYTLVMDHRGTSHVVLDNTGVEVGRRQYDAFGVILSQTGSWPFDLGYQTNWQTLQIGQKWWGLSAARLYDFATGAFTQRDPLKLYNQLLAPNDSGNKTGIFNQSLFEDEILLNLEFGVHIARRIRPVFPWSIIITDIENSIKLNSYIYCPWSLIDTADPSGLQPSWLRGESLGDMWKALRENLLNNSDFNPAHSSWGDYTQALSEKGFTPEQIEELQTWVRKSGKKIVKNSINNFKPRGGGRLTALAGAVLLGIICEALNAAEASIDPSGDCGALWKAIKNGASCADLKAQQGGRDMIDNCKDEMISKGLRGALVWEHAFRSKLNEICDASPTPLGLPPPGPPPGYVERPPSYWESVSNFWQYIW